MFLGLQYLVLHDPASELLSAPQNIPLEPIEFTRLRIVDSGHIWVTVYNPHQKVTYHERRGLTQEEKLLLQSHPCACYIQIMIGVCMRCENFFKCDISKIELTFSESPMSRSDMYSRIQCLEA